MTTLYGSLRLRPTRIGFLVRPSDRAAVRRIMRLCTCLWGGVYNPIIPVCRSLPSAWKDPRSRLNGSRLARGYLRFFEPDVFVEATPGLASVAGIQDSRIGIFTNRIVALDDFIDMEGGHFADFVFGQNIFELYRRLYEREFQFIPKRDRRIARVTGSIHDAPFIESIFSAFPETDALSYIEQAFHDIFDPEEISINATNWRRIIEGRFRTPLYFTSYGIERSYNLHFAP